MLLLHRNTQYIHRHMVSPVGTRHVSARHKQLRQEMERLQNHIQGISKPEGPTTCSSLRNLLDTGDNTYEHFNDSAPRDISEVLQHLLSMFSCPDAGKIIHQSEISHDGETWYKTTHVDPVLQHGVGGAIHPSGAVDSTSVLSLHFKSTCWTLKSSALKMLKRSE